LFSSKKRILFANLKQFLNPVNQIKKTAKGVQKPYLFISKKSED
jgi:hypothetical protein